MIDLIFEPFPNCSVMPTAAAITGMHLVARREGFRATKIVGKPLIKESYIGSKSFFLFQGYLGFLNYDYNWVKKAKSDLIDI